MRVGKILLLVVLCATAAGCAVRPVRGCIDRPMVCVAVGAAAAGAIVYATQAE